MKRIENISTANGKYSQSGINNTNYKILVFKSDLVINQNLRIVNNSEKKPYFMTSDLAKILVYTNIDSMAKYLVKENDKIQYKDTRFYNSGLGLGLQPNSIFINLNGFNDVLLRTKSKNAKSVKKWLSSEILPCLNEFYIKEAEETKEDNEEDGVEETKEDVVEETKEEKKIFKVVLKNNKSINIDIREDGYVDVTQLCKAGGKSFVDYQNLKQNQGYAEATSSFLGMPVSELIDIKLSCAYAHPKVACNVAKWISTDFEEQILDFFEEREKESPLLEYKKPLLLNNIEISSRQKDGYINLTSLCKAGNKDFKHWKENKKTKAFLEVLCSSVGIHMDELIKYESGSSENRATWGNPQVALNIAQWISPEFDIQVSKWIFELKEKNEHKPRLIEDTEFKLKLLNNEIMNIGIRKDGYVNATQLCKAGNKLFGHYQTSKQTQDYLQALSPVIGIPITELIDIKQGGINQGTYVHRKVAYHLAQWISPQFAVQVSNVLDELMLTGKVELGKEKSNEELENVYKEKLSEMENQLESTKNEFKVLSKTHNNMLRRQKRTPYEIGSVVYLISHEAFTGFYNTDYFKVGEATQASGENHSAFVNRLSGYNTSAPVNFKVNFLIYLEENQLLEKSTLTRFRKNLNPSNKEWIKSVDFKTITDYIVNMCELMNVEYKIVVNDPIVKNMENVSESISGVEEISEEIEENTEIEEEIQTEIEIEAEQPRKKINGKFECMICHECNISDKRAMNCVSCARQLSRKVKQRPTHEQLQEDVGRMSVVDIGKKYGVSDNCIRKWMRNP